MRAGEIAGADEEFTDDLAAGEEECGLEEFGPGVKRGGVMSIEPGLERTEVVLEGLNATRIFDGGIDLQTVADDAGVRKKAVEVGLPVGRDLADIEVLIGTAEIIRFLEYCEPGEASLINLEDEALEEQVIALEREAVLSVVVEPVKRSLRDGTGRTGNSSSLVVSGGGCT